MIYAGLKKRGLSMAAVAALTLATSQGFTVTAKPPLPRHGPVSVMSRQLPEMLPLLDSFLSTDNAFTRELAAGLPLSVKQLARLRAVVRGKAAQLQSISDRAQVGFNVETITTADQAWRQIVEIVGEEKAKRMFEFVLHRWQAGPADIAGLTLS